MRILILILFSTICCFAQKKDSLELTPVQLSKLTAIEKQLSELEQKKTELLAKQKDLLELIFDTKKLTLDRVRNLKYENGKFYFEFQ